MKVALPALLKVPTPSRLVPLKNETVPVAIPDPGNLTPTVAVRVTDWPKTGEPTELVTLVLVVVWRII